MMHGVLGRCAKTCHNKGIGLLVLRLSLGAFFVAHGTVKFQNMEMMQQFFASLGFQPWMAPLVAVVEILSGLALILGAFVWPAAVGITIIMALAVLKVTSKAQGDELTQFITGWGPNLIYAAAALCIAWCGAGRYSLTAWHLKRKGMAEGVCRDCKAGHGVGHDCSECPPSHA
jgi:uncharacterized membrane protein YphA (DoxX/SURF4 family)